MKNLILLITTLVLATMFVACEQQELITDEFTNIAETSIQTADLSDESNAIVVSRNMAMSFTLYAGQDIEAGEVIVDIDEVGGKVTVTYNTYSNWVLGATHLYVGDCEELPLTNKGNPKIGHFPYGEEFDIAQFTATYEIPLADILQDDGCFCLAAHAELLKVRGSEGEGDDEETGWADWNTEFDGNRWGGFSEICLTGS